MIITLRAIDPNRECRDVFDSANTQAVSTMILDVVMVTYTKTLHKGDECPPPVGSDIPFGFLPKERSAYEWVEVLTVATVLRGSDEVSELYGQNCKLTERIGGEDRLLAEAHVGPEKEAE